jgi:para-nitrobenzyl esterase
MLKRMWQKILAGLAVVLLSACGDTQIAAPGEAEQAQSPQAAVHALAPEAATTAGRIRGALDNGVRVFKGISYGADTSGTRFAAPLPAPAWDGVRDALAYGDSCPQTAYPSGVAGGLFESWGAGEDIQMSEDCLVLNVWTPALRDNRKRPVLVWYHGGGFSRGSGSTVVYDGVRLANRGDVVVVTVNHRLNVFGYLQLAEFGEEYADSGNAGILDLVLSLEWVRDNIAEFGGDPDNVMIFGESGGGAKVSVLMAMDAARGLFHRAVVQSGPRLENVDADVAAAGAGALVAGLGLDAETIGRIHDLNYEQIQEAAAQAVVAGARSMGSGPVFDHRHFARQPFAPDAPPQSADVPLLIGINRTETSLFIGARDPSTFDMDWEALPGKLSMAMPDQDADRVVAEYRRLNPDYGPADVLFTATTDAGFFRRSVLLADRKADQAGAPVYFYVFNWNTPIDGGKWGAPHALEIGMVFDNVAHSKSMSGAGENQQAIADIMADTWVAFARTGDPNNPHLPDWPPYTSGERQMMVLDLLPRVAGDVRGEERKLYD